MKRLRKKSDNRGFTLIEVLVSVLILTMAMAIVWQTFSMALNAWHKGETFLSQMHHGDFVIDQLTDALRSAAYFDESGGIYGFRLENRNSGEYPNDVLSWVKSGAGLMPQDAALARGLHRVDFTVDKNEDGEMVVMAHVYPHLADDDRDNEFGDGETWEISSVIKGINCRVYNEEDEEWSEEWENTNSIPAILEITLYMDPLEGDSEPVTIKRAVQIPISRELRAGVIFDESQKNTGTPPDDASLAAARKRAKEGGAGAGITSGRMPGGRSGRGSGRKGDPSSRPPSHRPPSRPGGGGRGSGGRGAPPPPPGGPPGLPGR
jgi:prepilin-type N-terminal cleavage/methylation domain-containing protein